jgi:transglutaminase-like putative cysteine protease
MNRRDFMRSTSLVCGGLAFSKSLPLFSETASENWRTFEVVTRVEVLKPNGVTHIWLPAALIRETPYQKTLSNQFNAEGGTAKLTTDDQNALGIVSATFPADKKPVLTLTSRVSTKPYAVDLSAPAKAPRASKAELEYFLQPSKYVPTDGIVKSTADKATAGAKTDVDKARAIYEWVVENTFRDPKVRGCGRGDIASCSSRATWAASVPT